MKCDICDVTLKALTRRRQKEQRVGVEMCRRCFAEDERIRSRRVREGVPSFGLARLAIRAFGNGKRPAAKLTRAPILRARAGR